MPEDELGLERHLHFCCVPVPTEVLFVNVSSSTTCSAIGGYMYSSANAIISIDAGFWKVTTFANADTLTLHSFTLVIGIAMKSCRC